MQLKKFTKRFYRLSIRCGKFFLYLAAGAAIFLGIERLCHRVTDGFALTRMIHPLPIDPELAPPHLSEEEQGFLFSLLSQPFYYLSCGGQTYVFLSEDGRYVIKFLKFHHRRVPLWLQKLPLPPALAHKRSLKVERKEFRLKRTLRSYVLAYECLKQETGMIYHHLSLTSLFRHSLTLFDRLGYRYEIPLDQCAFLIQKRGCSTAEMLRDLMNQGKIEEAKNKLSELMTLCLHRCQKGIGDRDFKFRSNLGFIDNEASQIDLGSLFLDEKQKRPEVYQHTIHEAATRFRPWLKENYPMLIDHFDQELSHLK
jgi:hypothetical protein